jgi:drug/metabolite transporter (DMT)-like permease
VHSLLSSLSPVHAAAVAALLAALLWGGGDFAGGFATKRGSPLQIIAIAQGLDVLLLIAACLWRHTPVPSMTALAWGFGGGLLNGLGLICLYTALAMAEMGLAAALAGLLTAALPVVADAFLEGVPAPRQLAGFLLAAVAIWRIAAAPTDAPREQQKRSLILASLAGVGFGLFLICSRQASREALLWPLLLSRLAGVLVALVLLAIYRNPRDRNEELSKETAGGELRAVLAWQPLTAAVVWLGIVAGTLDVAGNLLYMWATEIGRMDMAAVLASLYPASTIVLALVILRERPTRGQAVGMGLALAALLLIAR